MTVPLRSVLGLCLGGALLFACDGGSDPGDAPSGEQAMPAAETPPAEPEVGWPHHGLDHREQRFARLDAIDRTNVADLGLVWSADLVERRGVEATPLVVDGVLYATAGWSVVYAFDAVTGELAWRHDPEVPRAFLAKGR